jgi:subtilisin family serine protease
MSFLLAILLAVSVVSFSGKPSSSNLSSTGRPQTRDPKCVQGEIIIKMKPSIQFRMGKTASGAVTTGIASLDKLMTRFQGAELRPIFPDHARPTPSGGVDLTQFYRLHYRDGSDPKSVAKILQSTGAIEYAEPHYIRYVNFVPNDPFFRSQWHLKKIQAENAWDVTQGDTSVVIGIVDTGVEWNHPDLSANIWTNPGEIAGNGIDDDHNGFVDDVHGWDFGGLNGTPDNDPDEDRDDHGTFTAGLASAVTNNNTGVAGVGFKCKIMPVKTSQNNVRSTGGGALILYGFEGIVYAADNGASVVNTSWGGTGYSRFEQEIIDYVNSKGALVVAAAGNNGSDGPFYPAGYAHVLAVAATDPTDRRSNWGGSQSSNYGPHVGVSSPGDTVLSTWKPGTYASLNGTSPSAPIVSGTAALIKSLHPTWTPGQIAEQIRVTADPIDNLNPNYVQQLGLGRVNVFRAVSDNSSPGIQMTSYTLSDSIGGNNDHSLDPGDTIRLVGQFTNFLRPSMNAQAHLSTSDPFIIIISGSTSLGNIPTLETVTNTSSPLIFQVSPAAPENHEVVVYVNFTDGAYHDYTGISIPLNPTYKDHNINSITMTVTSKGALAFNDYPDNLQGTGLVFHGGGEDNLLFEGAFMAGTDASHVIDEARGVNASAQETDFLSQQRFSFPTPSRVSDQDGMGIFTDDGAGANKNGLRITLNTFAFKDAPDNNYIILKYTLHNTSGTPLSNLHAGLYFDWDVGSVYNNVTMYDPLRSLGYVYDTDQNGSRTYVGAAILTPGTAQFRAIDNDNTSPENPWGVYDGFTKTEKWDALSGGTTHAQEGPTDVSMVIGTGSVSIAANDSAVVGFAVLAASDLQNLQASTDAARQKWNAGLTETQRISQQIPLSFSLYQNYPNPFNPSTRIRYDLPSEGHVTLGVYNLIGQEVARVVDSRQSAGRHEVPFMTSNLSSGVYFFRIQAGRFTETRKMVLSK